MKNGNKEPKGVCIEKMIVKIDNFIFLVTYFT